MLTTPFAPPRTRQAQPVLSFEQAHALGDQHGTPLLVISRSRVAEIYQTMRNSLPGVELFYAAKANPNVELLRTLFELGASVDVCSPGELVAAKEAGFRPEKMLHTHPCKTESNLQTCYNEGVRWFVYDNSNELDKIARLAPDVNLLLRLAASSASSMINLSAKFGAALEDAISLLLDARHRGLNVRGFSFHIGSQCKSPEDFGLFLAHVRRLWNEALSLGFDLEVLDIGGGFPAPYRSDDLMTLEEYCTAVSLSLNEHFGDIPVRLIAEPGRGLCAETMTLVTRVIGKNIRGGIPWYIIDDGIYGAFSGKVFDHVDFPLLAENPFGLPTMPCIVAGPTCDSSDVVSRDQDLPDLKIGDLLLVPTMGAYTNASSCPFNGLPVAKIVSID